MILLAWMKAECNTSINILMYGDTDILGSSDFPSRGQKVYCHLRSSRYSAEMREPRLTLPVTTKHCCPQDISNVWIEVDFMYERRLLQWAKKGTTLQLSKLLSKGDFLIKGIVMNYVENTFFCAITSAPETNMLRHPFIENNGVKLQLAVIKSAERIKYIVEGTSEIHFLTRCELKNAVIDIIVFMSFHVLNFQVLWHKMLFSFLSS